MNIFLFFIITILILKYFFNIHYVNNIYRWLKILSILILLFLFYKYYNNPELKSSIIKSINKVDKVPIDRTFSDISNYFKSSDIQKNTKNNTKIKRNVTNGQKKYIASQQKWRCGHCNNLLDASYEVDHIQALYKGGSNDLDNLVALCRNCHGMKTTKERLNIY